MDQSILDPTDIDPRNAETNAKKIADYLLQFKNGTQNMMLLLIKEVLIENRRAQIEKTQADVDFLKSTLETLIKL